MASSDIADHAMQLRRESQEIARYIGIFFNLHGMSYNKSSNMASRDIAEHAMQLRRESQEMARYLAIFINMYGTSYFKSS
jgi:hypothetical protein